MLAFVSIMHSITIFSCAISSPQSKWFSLCTSIPMYFLLSMEGVPFWQAPPARLNLAGAGSALRSYLFGAYDKLLA